jgi:hypothetical protein
MRVKLSEKFKDEREEICNKLIEILDLDENNSFLLTDLDNDSKKQNDILGMKDEIKKCFAVSTISAFKPNFVCKRPCLNIVRSILRQQNFTFESSDFFIKYSDGLIRRTIKYKIFRNK